GADWNRELNRITDIGEFNPLHIDGELQQSLELLENSGIKVFTGEKQIGKTRVCYLQFQTCDFGKILTTYMGREITLENRVKAEAYELFGLDSLKYESMSNGLEYTHYLSLSYAISELARLLINLSMETYENWKKDPSANQNFSSYPRVSLHCHEFGVFYAAARLKKLGVPVSTVATLHATLPGRAAGYNSIQKIRTY